jgi:hypothetical protein
MGRHRDFFQHRDTEMRRHRVLLIYIEIGKEVQRDPIDIGLVLRVGRVKWTVGCVEIWKELNSIIWIT